MHNSALFNLSKAGLLSGFIAVTCTPYAFAGPAGRVDFALGNVSATGTDGAARQLGKGSEINNGDSISTGNGRIQIRFTDGAYLSLQPNTIFKVDNYTFSGKNDGSEEGFFSLVIGGLRTVSGLIGKEKRQNYEVRTPTATIGIRGTAYSANQNDMGLTVTVGQGAIEVTNQGGSLTIGSGQSAFVRSAQSSPQMTNEKAGAQTQNQQEQEQQQQEQQQQEQQKLENLPITLSDTRNSTGDLLPVTTTGTTVLTTGPGYTVTSVSSSPFENLQSFRQISNVTATFDDGGTLKQATDGAGNTIDFTTAAAVMAPETGADTLIGWGRWRGTVKSSISGVAIENTYSASDEGLHYVAGIPTKSVNLLFNTGAVISYALLGNTAPSTSNGTNTTSGSITGISVFPPAIDVTFTATPTMQMKFNVVTASAVYNMQGLGNIPIPLSTQATFSASSLPGACGGSGCSTDIGGFFSGSTGERLGIAYKIRDDNSNNVTKGAAAFTKY